MFAEQTLASVLAAEPLIVSPEADKVFNDTAVLQGLNPADPWVGGYVAYEWCHLRLVLEAYGLQTQGRQILEFGCNLGASAVVLAQLDATVRAIDIDEAMVRLACLNAARYGHADAVECRVVRDTRQLPYGDASFDLINCNSVLEYVDPVALPDVQREIHRVLKPGGHLLITGTSSRLWPKEVHSARWFTNYIPTWVDRWTGLSLQRGVVPWALRYGFGAGYVNLDAADRGAAFRESRRAMGTAPLAVEGLVRLAAVLRIGPGLLAPNISCVLRKPLC